ncbi:MAG: alpha/beta fold hydrolase [Solirubrobacterales bacterium]|nr:alpha/beta fold hydrolase [Solirubrobacterales bacterium]
MARFVMVHGAFVGAWCWEPLIGPLEAPGHTVETLDLPGSGDDRTPVEQVSLGAYAERVCAVLGERPEPAVLVPNSMGGMVATQAAARRPDRVASMVYVAAFLPRDGQSLLDLTGTPEGADDQVQANIVVEGEPPVATMPEAASQPSLYGCCADEVAAWAIAHQRPQAVAPFGEPVTVGDGAFDEIPRSYVLCTRDRAIPPALQRRMTAEAGITDVIELDTDHSPHMSRTAELAEILDRAAR